MKTVRSIRFSIKRPGKRRRSFAVTRDTLYLNGKREQVAVEDPRIDAVNLNLQRGILTVEQAHLEVKVSVVPALRLEAGIKLKESIDESIGDTNRQVFHKFWAERYEHGNLKNEPSTRNDLVGALRAIKPLSLTTASREELRKVLNTLPVHQQRRYVIRINQFLEYLGRPFTLEKKSRESHDVGYVTWDELHKIIPHIYSEEVRNLAVALWGTGVRLGEAFAPGFARLKPNDTIYINKQMDLNLDIRDIKNSKPHHTILLPEAKDGYLAWCKVPYERKRALREAAINQIIVASKKAFPKTKDKQISAHDLRHSYAIHWLGLGASLSQIANALGDSITTVQLHYTGFVMTDEQVEGMRKLLPSPKAG